MVAAVDTTERLRWGLDPVAFSAATGIDPDEPQKKLLRSSSKRILVNCTRQWGKSTTASRKALHGALFEEPGLTLLVSPSLRQSGELFRKVEAAIEALPPGLVDVVEHNRTSIRFRRGSRIVSLPASKDTIRGFSAPRRIIEDESAYVSDGLFTSVMPMLATGEGQYIGMSSPNGRQGHFFELWQKGEIERIEVRASACGRIKPEFLAEQRLTLGAELFAQEYCCQFVDAAKGRVYRPIVDAQIPDQNTVVQRLPKGDWSYIVGIDFGIVDLNAIAVLAVRPGDRVTYVVEAYKKRATPSEMVDELVKVQNRYQPVRIVGDLGGMGKAFAAEAEARYAVPIEPADKNNKLGFIRLLNAALERSELKVVATCTDLLDEWARLGWTASGKEDPSVENHCFIAGTMVRTEAGEKPVQDIVTGDRIWTREGLRPCIIAGDTGDRDLWRLTTTDGRELVGTGNHRIWTKSGWVELQLLTPGLTLETWESTDRASQSCSTGSSTEGILSPSGETSGCTSLRSMGIDCTERYGSRCAALSPTATTCTTSTKTRSTTTLETSPSSRDASISESTWHPRNGEPSLASASSAPLQRLQRGTDPKPVEHGMPKMDGDAQRNGSRFLMSVRCADEDTKQKRPSPPCAATSVSLGSGESLVSTMSTSSAQNAASRSGATAIRSQDAAPCHVLRVERIGIVGRVYNLGVESVHEYYANGILVANCADAVLYGWRASTSYAEADPAPKLTEDEAWEKRVIDARVRNLRKEWWET